MSRMFYMGSDWCMVSVIGWTDVVLCESIGRSNPRWLCSFRPALALSIRDAQDCMILELSGPNHPGFRMPKF